MAEELKACPFCGGAARLDQRVTQSLWNSSDAVFSHVACDECDIHGQDFCDDPDGSEAIEWWNARAQLPRQGGEAVEVVCITQGGCNVTWTATKELTPAGTALMSVRQHQRILAAATHPADQVAQPDAELVACLKFARTTMAVVADNANLRGVEYRSLIAEIKRIDAKLASLKGAP